MRQIEPDCDFAAQPAADYVGYQRICWRRD
jgi:hypothetical protein